MTGIGRNLDALAALSKAAGREVTVGGQKLWLRAIDELEVIGARRDSGMRDHLDTFAEMREAAGAVDRGEADAGLPLSTAENAALDALANFEALILAAALGTDIRGAGLAMRASGPWGPGNELRDTINQLAGRELPEAAEAVDPTSPSPSSAD